MAGRGARNSLADDSPTARRSLSIDPRRAARSARFTSDVTTALDSHRDVSIRYQRLAGAKILLKMCCTKIKDAYKYGEEHGRVFVNHFSFADSWSTKLVHSAAWKTDCLEDEVVRMTAEQGDQSFGSQTRTCSLRARYGMSPWMGGRFSLEATTRNFSP